MLRADRERTAAILDLHEGRHAVAVLDDAGVAAVLRQARRIAVVGASSRTARPSNGVMASLLRSGYDVVPVSPRETEVLGGAATRISRPRWRRGSGGHRRRVPHVAACPGHAREAASVGAGCLWLQLGIVSWEAARIAADAGIAVVMDRCTSIEVARLRGPG